MSTSELFYTKDYEGEMVIVALNWREKNDPSKMTWVEKTIINNEHDGIAHVIGNSLTRKKFPLILLHGQTGGEKVRGVGQSYGCNYLYKDFNPTFLICLNPKICKEIVESGYCEDNIVYSNLKNIIQNPNNFHLYPKIFTGFTGSLALRLACADGHKTIYMLGMSTYLTNDDNMYIGKHDEYNIVNKESANKKMISDCCNLFSTYSDVQFNFVCENGQKGLMPDEYKWFNNVQEITTREYINMASLGAIHR